MTDVDDGTAAAAEDGAPVELLLERVAHGGSCVARSEGRVVFVRHGLPGERVLARLTDADPGARYWRADAVTVLEPAPGRVEPRCEVARPGGCGGCDWQHASLELQRDLKADVVREQLSRLAGLEWPGLRVEEVPGSVDGLGWRTRVRFTADDAGRLGLRAARSHRVVPLRGCPIAHPAIDALRLTDRAWPASAVVEVAVGSQGDPLVLLGPAGVTAPPDLPGAVAVIGPDGAPGRVRGRARLEQVVEIPAPDGARSPRSFRVSAGGFWQVHPAAAQTLSDAVLEAAAVTAGERVLDLYSGVGLFTVGLGLAVGTGGSVTAVEAFPTAVADARRNCHDLPQVRLVGARVERHLRATGPGPVDVVVADPPRTGLGREVVRRLVASRPRALVLVSCDPASGARDIAEARAGGYRVATIRAFDLFPMTSHVETVTLLERET